MCVYKNLFSQIQLNETKNKNLLNYYIYILHIKFELKCVLYDKILSCFKQFMCRLNVCYFTIVRYRKN